MGSLLAAARDDNGTGMGGRRVFPWFLAVCARPLVRQGGDSMGICACIGSAQNRPFTAHYFSKHALCMVCVDFSRDVTQPTVDVGMGCGVTGSDEFRIGPRLWSCALHCAAQKPVNSAFPQEK